MLGWSDVLALAGQAVVVVGIGLIYVPAAAIYAGLVMTACAVNLALRERK